MNTILVHWIFHCRKGRGECCATTSMWKVELFLEFNFLSGSSFLSRLVRQVISVPFVVWINATAAPRRLFCLIKVSPRGLYWSNCRCLAGLANKDCVNSKTRTFWAMRGKKKMKQSIIQAAEGNKDVQVKNKRKLRQLISESCPDDGNESGSRKNFSIYSKLFTAVV